MAIVIPVVDVLGGRVVHAVRGDRRNYQAIRSSLCAGSDPLTVGRALLARRPSPILYMADLDALQGGPVQTEVIGTLLSGLPDTELWLDAGFTGLPAVAALEDRIDAGLRGRLRPVFASESLVSTEALRTCCGGAAADQAVLSLDRRDGRPLDPAGCWEAPELWPRRVIVMTLERVGADAGPDLTTVAAVRRRAPSAWLVGAGGVRNAADLAAAGQAGAQAWLVASALHDGRL
jgi:phosphoribosylformimino-5-aminoimidazole carboxamide ribotide isomerase